MIVDKMIGERCKRFKLSSSSLESAEIPMEASHGDMVVLGEKEMCARSKNVYFVVDSFDDDDGYEDEENEHSTQQSRRKLVQKERADSDGRCCVPLEVSIRIADPIRFYENAFTFDCYDEVDFEGIEIDTCVHQEIIQRFTANRPVHSSRQCFYFFSRNEWDSSAGMFIWCDFFLDDFGLGRYMKLSADIDTNLLEASPAKQRDPLILSHSLEMKHNYEVTFTRQLASMKRGQVVEVFGAAFFDPLRAVDSAVLSMRLSRIENNDTDISTIFLFIGNDEDDVEEDDKSSSSSTDPIEIGFTKRVLTPYGRFGGAELWCAHVAASILDGGEKQLVTQDYDDPSTRICVICSSDLFF